MAINKSDFNKPLSQVNKSIEAKKRKNKITDHKFEDAFINPIKKGKNDLDVKLRNLNIFEKDIKSLEEDLDASKNPFDKEGITEVNTNKIEKIC